MLLELGLDHGTKLPQRIRLDSVILSGEFVLLCMSGTSGENRHPTFTTSK